MAALRTAVGSGGINALTNLVLACKACNYAKADSLDWVPFPPACTVAPD